MLGDFLTRIFILLFGYAYPAFECFKAVEKNKVQIEELRFWCQYWIIISILTVLERVGDIFISWLPMYGEVKLAFFIYLWYPKTKGTGYIYETMFRPIIARHETEIDRKLMELRARAWDFALYYWQNCTKLGQSTFFQLLEYIASQSGKVQVPKDPDTKSKKNDDHEPRAPPRAAARDSSEQSPAPRAAAAARDSVEPSARPRTAPFLSEAPSMSKHRNSKWPPRPPSSSTINRSVSELSKSNRFQVNLDERTEFVKIIDPAADSEPNNPVQARMKLRRSTTMQA